MKFGSIFISVFAAVVLQMSGLVAFAGITVQQNLGPGAASWPGTPLLSTTSMPNIQSTVGEGFSGSRSNLAQTFTMPAGNNYTLDTIDLYAGEGSGTSGSSTITANLYDLGALTAPNPSPYSANNNLLGGGSGVSIAYTVQPAGLLRLDFSGNDRVVLAAGHMYAIEIAGVSGTTPLLWYRTISDSYAGGAAYVDRSWINGGNAREFSLAVYGTFTTDQAGPVSCMINAASVKQRIDGFGAGVAFLYAPPDVPVSQDPLPDSQMDQLFGTTGTQFGLTLLRMRIPPDGNYAANVTDGQRARARGVRILATPWTPPASMKDNGALIHGSLLSSQYGAYVSYLNNFASTMAANGAAVDVVSLQNEPDFDPTYEGCAWTAEQFRTFCRDFAGSIAVPVMMPESYNYNQALSDTTLNDPAAAANVDFIGGHLYGALIKDYPLARAAGLPLWMTEYLENDQTIASAVTTGRQISDCLSIGNMSAYLWWKCIGDANGLLDNAATPQRRGYVMAQFSRFVRPGDYRVDVPINSGPMGITAFKNLASGSIAIVAVNNTNLAVNQTFNLQGVALSSVTPTITSGTQTLETQSPVAVSGGAFSYTVPAVSIVTFTSLTNGSSSSSSSSSSSGSSSSSSSSGGGGASPTPSNGGGGANAPWLVGLMCILSLFRIRRSRTA